MGGWYTLTRFFPSTTHDWRMMPLQYVNAESLIWLFRVADPSRSSKGLGFGALSSMAHKLIRIFGRQKRKTVRRLGLGEKSERACSGGRRSRPSEHVFPIRKQR